MTDMRGKNLLKQQLQTGKVNSPSQSGVLKKSGTVRIVHASIHEPPKKRRGSLTKEKKAVEKKERNADKVEFDKGEKPEKVCKKKIVISWIEVFILVRCFCLSFRF